MAEGAKLLRDGRADAAVQGQGYFIGPTLFDGVTREMKIWQEEIFAPVLAVIRVKDVEEAIEIANTSRFANGACIFTNDGGKVRYFRENIESGMLGVNVGVPAPMAFSLSPAGRIPSMAICMRMEATGLNFIHAKSSLPAGSNKNGEREVSRGYD